MKEPERLPIYARGYRAPDAHKRIYVPIFTHPEAARAWFDFFIEGEDPRRVGDTFHLDDGFTLTSACWDKILKASSGELSPIDERRILRFRHGTWDEQRPKAMVPEATASSATSKPEREARPERPTGYVTITELCAASDVLPMHARAALRASGREKPKYGWAFDPREVPAIKEICGIT